MTGDGSQSLRQKGTTLFKAMLYRSSSRLCVPDVFYVPTMGGNDGDNAPEQRSERRKHRLNCVELWGALAGTQNKASPVSEDDGWGWLIKMGKQLHHIMHKKKVALDGNDHNTAVRLSSLEQECCTALYVMLRQSCAALIVQFGWPTVKDSMIALQQMITSDTTRPSPGPNASQIPQLQNTQTGEIYALFHELLWDNTHTIIITIIIIIIITIISPSSLSSLSSSSHHHITITRCEIVGMGKRGDTHRRNQSDRRVEKVRTTCHGRLYGHQRRGRR